MATLTILGIALALAMDAFSVAVAAGVSLPDVTGRHVFRLAWHFGLFQFLMPVIGWAGGRAASGWLERFDHWIAFGLLGGSGVKMVRESVSKDEEAPRSDPTRGFSLVLLSVATSIDALAVGVSLALLDVTIVIPSLIIGFVCGLMTILGIRLGRQIGLLLGKRIECVGGLVLIGVGVRILVTS